MFLFLKHLQESNLANGSNKIYSQTYITQFFLSVTWNRYKTFFGTKVAKAWLLPCPLYLHTSLLACLHTCLLTFQCTRVHRRLTHPVITVNSNHSKLQTSHPLIFHQLYLVYFRFRMLYLPGLGGSLLSSVTPSYPLPPKIPKPTYKIWLFSSSLSTFQGVCVWGGD